VGQVCNLPLLPIFNFQFFLVHPVGRLETCPTTKSTALEVWEGDWFEREERKSSKETILCLCEFLLESRAGAGRGLQGLWLRL
jgi:hypothetical protein